MIHPHSPALCSSQRGLCSCRTRSVRNAAVAKGWRDYYETADQPPRSLLTRAWLFGNFLEGVLLSCGLLSSPDTITCFMAMLELIACRLWSSRLRVGETSELCVIVTWMVNGTGLWRRGCGSNRMSTCANPLQCSLWECNSISRERHTRVTVY